MVFVVGWRWSFGGGFGWRACTLEGWWWGERVGARWCEGFCPGVSMLSSGKDGYGASRTVHIRSFVIFAHLAAASSLDTMAV